MHIRLIAATFAVLTLTFSACQKKELSHPAPTPPADNAFIAAAHQFVNQQLANTAGIRPNDPLSANGHALDWSAATYHPSLHAVSIPIKYADSVLFAVQLARNLFLFPVGDVTRLVVTRDTTGHFHMEVQRRIPDSNHLSLPTGPFTGLVLTEDWTGHPRGAHLVTTTAGVITICTTINGYNYGIQSPGDGYHWSRTICTSRNIPTDQDGGGNGNGSGGAGGGGGGGSTGTGANTIVAIAPSHAIENLADYLKCFTLSSSATYQLQICVDQPSPGTRTHWVTGYAVDKMVAEYPVNVGHTFLVLTETDGSHQVRRSVGLYPTTPVYPLHHSSPGALGNDQTHQYNVSAAFTVTQSHFFSVLEFINNSAGTTYDLNTNNCTTWAVNAMQQAGISLPRTVGTWAAGSGMGLNPGDLGEDLRTAPLPDAVKTLSNPGTLHMNNGTCD